MPEPGRLARQESCSSACVRPDQYCERSEADIALGDTLVVLQSHAADDRPSSRHQILRGSPFRLSDLVVRPDGAVTADLDVYRSQLVGSEPGSSGGPSMIDGVPSPPMSAGIVMMWSSSTRPARSRAPLSPPPASDITHRAPSCVRIFASACTQINLVLADQEVGNLILAEAGQIRQRRAVTGYDEQARLSSPLCVQAIRPRASTTANHRGLRYGRKSIRSIWAGTSVSGRSRAPASSATNVPLPSRTTVGCAAARWRPPGAPAGRRHQVARRISIAGPVRHRAVSPSG